MAGTTVSTYMHCIFSFTKQKGCQVFDSYVHSSNYALLAIAEMPNNELTSIHTLSLPPDHLDNTHHRGHNSTSAQHVQLVTEIVHITNYVYLIK